MSIDPNVGALKDYLTDVRTSKTYNKVKDEVWNVLGKLSKFGPDARSIVANVEKSVKSYLLKHSNLFEALNLRYFGPVDGHNVDHLVDIFQDLKKIPGPKILHTVTVKGKGYALAEKDQTKWHAPGKFDSKTGEILKTTPTKPQPPKYQDVFGHSIIELAKKNDKIMGITPAMPSGSSLNLMMEAMPDRAFDVDIAEQHAVTFSAGLATEGLVPFCNIYSTFMQRAYDQVIHDVCIQNLNVVFCLDRAGFAGADGSTHHGAFDIAFMRCIPNLIISSPLNESELRNLMYTAQLPNKGPFSIRYPRGNGVMSDWKTPFKEIEIGKGQVITEGEDLIILSFGPIGKYAIEACKHMKGEGINIAHYDMRFTKPLDTELLKQAFTRYSKIITLEDGCISGGFGSAVLEWANDNQHFSPIYRLGIPDKFIDHGEQHELHDECDFDTKGVIKTIKKALDLVKA